MKNYKALIFDMDGTLLDTLTGVISACNASFKEFGYDIVFTNDDGKYFIGAGAAEFARRALVRANIAEIDLLSFSQAFLKHYEVYQKLYTKPFVGLDKLLEKLKNSGYLIGICSNKPQHLLDQVTAQMFPNNKFDLIVGQREGIPCKPSPEMMEIVKGELNLNNDDLLYIGDSEYDFNFAKNAKTDCCIVTYGYGIYENEFMKHVTYKVDNIEQLERMLLIK